MNTTLPENQELKVEQTFKYKFKSLEELRKHFEESGFDPKNK